MTTHVVLRGTYLPGTVRCTTGHRFRYPSYADYSVDYLLVYCFADVRVNAYLLGSGPSTLTVIVESSLYIKGGSDDDYGVEQLESRRRAYERALSEGGLFKYDDPLRGRLPPDGGVGPLRPGYRRDGPEVSGPPGGIGGREVVLFIRPSRNLSVEAWDVRYTWDVERREDGTVVAIHPYGRWLTLDEYRSVGEMELPALTQAVTTAHQARVAANGGRIGAATSLPMLVTDANQLRQYFSDPKVGAYAPGAPTPTQPPPPCGLAVPDQANNPGLMRDCSALLAARDMLRDTATLDWTVTSTTPTSVPTQTPTPTSVPTQTPIPTSAPILTQTPLSVPTQTPIPTSVPTQTPIPTSVPILTLTATSAPTPTYLTEEIPPCTPALGSSVDPCEPGTEWALITSSGGQLILVPPSDVGHFLNEVPGTPSSTPHVVLRGTYLPGTVRCTTGHRFRYPSYADYSVDYLLVYCFADVRVNAYLLGSGPSSLTVIVERSIYIEGGSDDDYGVEQLESRRSAYERALSEGGLFKYDDPLRGRLPPGGGPLRPGYRRDGPEVSGPPGGISGREGVLFIRPSRNLSVEAWEVVHLWDVKRREDGTVVAIHPYGRWLTPDEYRSLGEMELPALTQAVTTVHQARIAANGGRIGEDDSLPMLVTDVNQLHQYFSDPKVGAYAPGAPTPEQPPPPCGLAVPNQADNPGLMRDCITLLAAKDTLRGTATLDWTVSSNISTWEGIGLNSTSTRITVLDLDDEDLDGTIPPALGGLSALVTLDLSDNDLTGEIPEDLGRLWSLETLRLSGNSFAGCIPPTLEDVPTNDLASLNIQYCQAPAPSGVSASLSDGTFSIGWTAMSGVDQYEVQYQTDDPNDDWAALGTATTTTLTHTPVIGPTCGTTYQFRVRAYGDGTQYQASWGPESAPEDVTTEECDRAPRFGSTHYSFSIAEDAATSTSVGTVSATDEDGDTVTYEIANENPDGKFAIAEMLGVPARDMDRFKDWSNDVALTVEPTASGAPTRSLGTTSTASLSRVKALRVLRGITPRHSNRPRPRRAP